MSNLQKFALSGLAGSLRDRLPGSYFVGIILSYLANAILIIYFLDPLFSKVFGPNSIYFLTAPGALVVQYFRFLIVFTDQLLPNGQQTSKKLVQLVAFTMTLWGMFEAYHLVSALDGLGTSEFWGAYGFALSIIIGGYILEISFVKKTNELTTIEIHKRQEQNKFKEEINAKNDKIKYLENRIIKLQQSKAKKPSDPPLEIALNGSTNGSPNGAH